MRESTVLLALLLACASLGAWATGVAIRTRRQLRSSKAAAAEVEATIRDRVRGVGVPLPEDATVAEALAVLTSVRFAQAQRTPPLGEAPESLAAATEECRP